MITEPFPFNHVDNITNSVFSLQRPDDIPIKAVNSPVEYFSQGLGYWSGSVTGVYDDESDIRKINSFLSEYSDGRPFDLDLTYYYNGGFFDRDVLGPGIANFSPTLSVESGGQFYLAYSANQVLQLNILFQTYGAATIGFSKGDYFSYKGQLFQLPANQQKNGDWRIPLFPNVKFAAFAGSIDSDNLIIKAKLDKERGIPELGYNLENQGVITIPWIQGVKWG